MEVISLPGPMPKTRQGVAFESAFNNTLIGEMISDRMQKLGLSIRDVSGNVDMTYEHVRRIVRGEALPSRFVLKPMCEYLGLNYKEADKLANADRIRKKFGTIPLELAGKNPELEPIEKVWNKLTEQQKRDAISMIQGWARNNRTFSK
jgi:transcriptional regulator with XRE-family HTH domain